MRITDTYRALEIGIWHNGKPKVAQYGHTVDFGVVPGYWTFRIASNETNAFGYDVRIDFQQGIVNGYVSGQMWLMAWDGSVIAPPRPTLIHTEPSDLPMVTIFPCTWNDDRMAGIWAVSTRVTFVGYEVPDAFNPIREDDERKNPRWPAIRPDAPMIKGCAEVREDYDRTRCYNPDCPRCWGAEV